MKEEAKKAKARRDSVNTMMGEGQKQGASAKDGAKDTWKRSGDSLVPRKA
jgi:hypothetical protein